MVRFPSVFLPLILAHFMIFSVLQSADNPNAADLTALLDFKNQISDDPQGIMATWNDSSNHCNWTGITCNPSTKRVEILNLRSQKLVGSLPPSIGNLSFLTGLELRNNTFKGHIPQELGLLSNLKHLNLTNNLFTGAIPSTLSNCTKLSVLFLEYNQLSGQIPTQFASLSELVLFSVKANNLTGTFPDWIGNLSSRFSRLSLSANRFHGSIPPQIGSLSGLTLLQLSENQFSGELPSSIYNLSSLNVFSIASNRFQGKIPQDIGFRFPNLETLQGGLNNFTGEIPVSLANASRLGLLDLAQNSLTGTLPSVLGRLPFVYWINFEHNLLGNRQAGDMNFLSSLTNCTELLALGLLSNSFGGELPLAVANLSTKLEALTLGENYLRGNIPIGIGNLVSLTALGFELNEFTGSIPEDIGKLQKLSILQFDRNQLTGMIPISFGNLTSLNEFYLNSNKLQGTIPPQLGNCTSLLHLNISSNNLTGSIPKAVMSLSSLSKFLGVAHNSLSGPLPVEVGRLTHLKELDVSGNRLSGAIPSSLGSCLSLEILIMEGNQFEGTVPESLGALRGLEVVDFSHNNLSGKIPVFLGKLPFITKLDLSYNNLEGEVLNEGVFSNATVVSVVGNKQLCGGAASLNLPACSIPVRKSNENRKLRWIIPLTVSLTLCGVLICSLGLWYILRKPKKQPNTITSSPNDSHLAVSYLELHKATNGFCADNLIGSGSFGSVYKGILGENSVPVAVKVLKLEQKGAIKSFLDECAVLRSTKHRNLLKIVTVCSGFDPQGRDFKSLVTELMANGSLDAWLHHPIGRDARKPFQSRTLTIMERLNIAIDVASAVDYLHNYSHTPIIHCDLKPSNILLDEDLTAHVGDFGLAKVLLQSANRPLQNHSISVELRGSIGYIPPEYGTSTRISTLGDVYSYGILVLELFTGKRPTDDMFNDGLSIHKYISLALSERIIEVLDPSLILAEEAEREHERETRGGGGLIEAVHKADDFQKFHSRELDCLVSVLKIGVSCSVAAPEDRMPISTAVNQLHAIRANIGKPS